MCVEDIFHLFRLNLIMVAELWTIGEWEYFSKPGTSTEVLKLYTDEKSYTMVALNFVVAANLAYSAKLVFCLRTECQEHISFYRMICKSLL